MNEQRRDQQHGQHQQDHKREAPGAGQQQQHDNASERAIEGEKPKTEQASHQGGGGVRKDHLPQGK
jgi:hypothetical protein